MSVSKMREFAAILYEHVEFEIECTRCGECCEHVPFLTTQEKVSIIENHGNEVIQGQNLTKGENGRCIFYLEVDGISGCKLHRSCKPTSCRAFFCKKLLQEKYGLDDEQYYQFIAYWRREIRMEEYGEAGIGYD